MTLPPIEGDEEATLDEHDGVPAVRDEEPARPRRAARPAAACSSPGLALVLLVAICGFAVWGLWRSYFVGAEPDGHVAVYQGVPWNIVGSVRLYRVGLREPAAGGAALPGRAAEALRPRPAQRRLRAAPWSSRYARARSSPVSYRNRELVNLVVVARPHRPRLRERLHRAPGRRLDRLALVRALLPRPLPRRAPRRADHRAVGRPVPAAAGRAADRDRRDRDLPARPDRRVPPGALDRRRRRRLRADAPPAAHDYRRLESYKYLFGLSRDRRCSSLPALPVIGTSGQRRAALGARRAAPVPARRAREDRADRLPRRLPAREARGARPGPAEGLRPAAPDLGRGDARPRRDERPRQRAPLLRDLPGDALRRDRPGPVRRRRARPLRSPARRSSTTSSTRVEERVDIWLDPWADQAATAHGKRRATSSSSRSTRSRTAASAAPASARARSRRPAAPT